MFKASLRQYFLAGACMATTPLAAANPLDALQDADSAEASNLVIATWNAEHLAYPISDGCRPRSADELSAMQAYAKSLNADVVALQEVGSKQAVELLFPADQWQILMSERPDNEPYTCRKTGYTSTQQKVAFAVRKGVKVNGIESLAEFGLDNPGLRHGLELEVESPFGPMSLLNLHMKSGCFVDSYQRGGDSEACQLFARQAPILDAWVEKKEREGKAYALLGDFNHRLSAPYNQLTRELTSNSDGSESSLENATAELMGCHPYYPAPIDHVWVGNMPTSGFSKTPKSHHFDDMDPDTMLSDHCALSLNLSIEILPLTNSVKWQTRSKEYRYLTTSIYADAADTLLQLKLPSEPWTVVMDIDETVLDNSAYQVNLDRTATTFASATWANWIASEQATLVPGVKAFIETVVELGGSLALVTNRDRAMDNHTWRNLLAHGLPLTKENTCLMGRHPDDKEAVENGSVINDKDLRRQQIRSGSASCYLPGNSRHQSFAPQQILMQVGDNIEDFAGITQEDANIVELLKQSNGQLVLLPNPMYGSWR